jgi:flagellar basal body-associated protein FliL
MVGSLDNLVDKESSFGNLKNNSLQDKNLNKEIARLETQSQENVPSSLEIPNQIQSQGVVLDNSLNTNQTSQPSISFNYVSDSSSFSNNLQAESKKNKIIFLLAIVMFLLSLVGLIFYFINAWRENRLKKTDYSFSPTDNQIIQTTPTPLPLSEGKNTKETKEYRDESVTFKYPYFLTARKDNDFVVLNLEQDETQTVLKLKILPRSKVKESLVVLSEEVSKIDQKIGSEDIRNNVLTQKINSYTILSYTENKNNASVFSIFDDEKADKRVFIADFSGNIEDLPISNLTWEILSNFSFLAPQENIENVEPSVFPSGKFDIQN